VAQGLARRWNLIHRQRANQGIAGGESHMTNALEAPSHEALRPQCRDMRDAPLPRLLPTKCGTKPTCVGQIMSGAPRKFSPSAEKNEVTQQEEPRGREKRPED
jgi:hypothetical protein